MMAAPDPHALYELDILEAVERDCHLTNRLVARKLGVSLKLAHELLKRMVQRGLLQVNVVHSRRWDYFLTPRGVAEKRRLTLEFIDFSMRFYREARHRSSQLCRELHDCGILEVGFIGAGDLAEIVYLGVQECGLELRAVFADGSRTDFMGHRIESLSLVAQSSIPVLIVCCYDAHCPMRDGYLPAGVRRDRRMHWVFKDAAIDAREGQDRE